ncbi:MAG: rRNA maturation RNase YbeY [Candidatus Omnitrophota bacterium]|jgi:probable rRNA maturation factor
MNIKIINLHKRYKINERLVKKIAGEILKFCRSKRRIELNLIFLDDRAIRILNKKYRGKDIPTDVLTFTIAGADFSRKTDLGEAYISIDRARANAAIFDTDFASEVVLYVIHAILHILGYEDEDAKSFRRMSKKQQEVLKHICKWQNLSKVLMPQ